MTDNKKVGFEEIPNEIQMGRESALLGMYEKSLRHMRTALLSIHEHVRTLSDPVIIDSWEKVEKEIKDETKIISDIYTSLDVFKGIKPVVEHHEPKKQQAFPAGFKKIDKRHQQQSQQNILDRGGIQSDRELGHHNSHVPVTIVTANQEFHIGPRYHGPPPHHHVGGSRDEGFDDYVSRMQKHPSSQQVDYRQHDEWGGAPHRQHHMVRGGGFQHYSATPTSAGRDHEPDGLFGPPPPLPKRKPAPKRKGKEAGGGGGGGYQGPREQDIDKRRNYKRDWMPPKKEKKKKEANTYLEHAYGEDGDGPDADLIKMLERDIVVRNPNVKFDDIAELDDAKKVLWESTILPLIYPDFFTGIRSPCKGIMLFGPPGTGKTMLAKALATMGKTTFFNVSAASLASKWRGDSEKLVRILFDMARFYGPTTVFIDEIDSLASRRGDNDADASRRMKTQLLVQMDGMNTEVASNNEDESTEASSTGEKENKRVMILGATNRPWDLDEAVIRRLQKRVCKASTYLLIDIPLPNKKGREQLFKINLREINLDNSVSIEKLVASTEGYSGADITSVCRDAAMMPLRSGVFCMGQNMFDPGSFDKDKLERPITMSDFEKALQNIKKSVSNQHLGTYAKWMKDYGAK